MTRKFLSVLCALGQPVLDQPVDKTKALRTHEESCTGVYCIYWPTLQFYSEVCDVYIYQITSFYPLDYVPHTRRRFTVSYEMKTNVTYSASHFTGVDGAQRCIFGFIFVFSRPNGKPQRPTCAKQDIYCLDTAEFIDRDCSLRGMNKEESKVKVGINYGK